MIHAAILCRVSTEGQRDNTSLPDQRRILTELCERNGWAFEVFEEIESGGAGLANRPVLAAIMGRIAAGEFQRLVVLVPDRLSRAGVGELEQISAILARVGATLVTQSGEFDPRNLDHGLALDLQAVLAKNERLRIRERTIRGREARIRDGSFAGHPIPYGWRRVWNQDGSYQFVVDEDEAAVVREIYRLYMTGVHGFLDIAQRLNVSRNRVAAVLASPRYAGIEQFRRNQRKMGNVTGRDPITVPSKAWPPIVTVAEWEAVVAVRGRKLTREPGRASGPSKYPLAGIIRCGGCGGKLYYVKRKPATAYYYCTDKACPDRQCLRADDAHKAVLRRLPDVIAAWTEAAATAGTSDGEAEQRELAARLADLKRRENALFDLFGAGSITSGQLSEQNQRLIDERTAINAKMAERKRKSDRSAMAAISAGDAAMLATASDDLLNDYDALSGIISGIFASVRVGRSSRTYNTGRTAKSRAPVLSLIAATMHDGTVWSRVRVKTHRDFEKKYPNKPYTGDA